MRLIVHRGAETVEADDAEDDDYNHQDKAKFGLVDAVVAAREAHAEIVV